MVRVRFHGWGLPLLVEADTADAWRAFSTVMARHDYRLVEPSGGTYSCRRVAGTDQWSLHAYGLALDLNPSRNTGADTDQPAGLRADLKGIVTVSGRHVFAWGGDWDQPDSMHWQIGATPDELSTGIQEDEMALSDEDVARVAKAVWDELVKDDLNPGETITTAVALRRAASTGGGSGDHTHNVAASRTSPPR